MNTPDPRSTRGDAGFSLVELMVVVLIIAVLIAIAVPTFMGARDRAQDRAIQSNMSNALKAVRASGSGAGGYGTIAFADLPLDEPQLSWVVGSVPSTDDTTMSVAIDNPARVVTLAALHPDRTCFFVRDWFNQPPGVEYAVLDPAVGLDCTADNGTNAAVAWSPSW